MKSAIHAGAGRRALMLVALAAAPACAGGVPPLHLAIPAIYDRDTGQESPTDEGSADFRRVVGILLRERQRDCPSIQIVSQGRNDAIMGELTSPMRSVQPAELLDEFRKFQAVDAVAFYRWSKEGRVEVQVLADAGAVQTNIDVTALGARPLIPAARKALGFIADNLPIPAQERQALREIPMANDELVQAVCFSLYNPEPAVVAGRMQTVSGPTRLKVLLPYWSMEGNDPFFAAAALKGAHEAFLAESEIVDGVPVPHAKWLAQEIPESWILMIKSCFEDVLGTRDEPAALPMARLAPMLLAPAAIELAKPVLSDFVMDQAVDAGAAAAEPVGIGLTEDNPEVDPVKGKVPRSRRLGALRMLGAFAAPEARALMARALTDDDPQVRAAAAAGAGLLAAPEATAVLQPLLQDPDPRVAFTAALGLWKAGARPDALVGLARRFATDPSSLSEDAIACLAAVGGEEDAQMLQTCAVERRGPRAAVVASLLRRHAASDQDCLAWLSDADETLIQAALEASPDLAQREALRPRLEALANDPCAPLASRARYLLARHRPADPRQALAQELRTEHPYIREQILDALAADNSEPATPLLEAACDNADPHARAKALGLLVARAPALARPHVAKALADGHRWVRFHAAALAPGVATPDLIPALQRALDGADHSATRLYLREALAKAGGGPAPPAPEPARSIAGTRNLAWCTTPGLYTDDSPFDAYYCMDTAAGGYPPIANMHKAHDAGKILFARASPIVVPGRLILDLAARDEFVTRLDRQLSDDVAQILDGIIYGEETMAFTAEPLWEDGWQLFCRDAKLDPAAVAGRIENLNTFERRAWEHWAGRINIQGFNKLYDFTKLRYGKLRPGLQVGTFQTTSRQIKFDFSGIYDYRGDNRLCAYDLVRHSKTFFPERPVLWLSLGLGGYDMNPVRNTDEVPAGPLFDTYNQCWSDSLTAWLAGAQNGWFSVWLFYSPLKGRTDSGPASLRGIAVWLEDIRHDSALLSRAIDWTQAHEATYEAPVELPAAPTSGLLDPGVEPDQALIEDPQAKLTAAQTAHAATMAGQKERMTVGFLYNQQYVYDCARIFASLPRQEYRSPALVNRDGVDVWTVPGAYPLVPAAALLNRYDYALGFNDIPGLDLARYRLFITHAPALLKDESIRAVSAWLRDTPGLLVVHGDLTADNGAEDSTVEDHDGRLMEDWPWEHDLRVVTNAGASANPDAGGSLAVRFGTRIATLTNGAVGSCFELAGSNATSIASVEGRTVLALWRHPAFKGAVLFDGMQFVSMEYLNALRATINAIYREHRIGMLVEGPALVETLNSPAIKAAAATRYYKPVKEAVDVPGVGVLSGFLNPAVGRLIGSTSALTLGAYTGRFLAASESLNALSETPFREARVDADSLILKSDGVVRVASASGGLTLAALDGTPLPGLKSIQINADTASFDKAGFARWLFDSKEQGVFALHGDGAVMWYFRWREAVRVRPSPRPARAATPPDAKGAMQMEALQKAQTAKEAARARPTVEELVLDLGGGVRMPFVKLVSLNAWAGKYEVANEEYRRFRPGHGSGDEALDGARQPAVNVSYDDATAFVDWLNQAARESLPSGLRARLPNGDEWLAMAQCGDNRIYPWGNQWPPAYGNYFDRWDATNETALAGTYQDGYVQTCPVEDSGRNEWGLYGVGGNVWEWTSELAPVDGDWRIRRGAFWGWELWGTTGYEEDLRCAHRSYAFPSLRHQGTGFRLILAAPQPVAPQ